MRSTLKLFCVGLIAAGLILSGCERPAEEGEEATAEEAEEPAAEEEAEEEAPAEEEAEEEEAPAEEEAEGDAGEAEGADAAAEGAAAEEKPAEQAEKKQKVQTPPFVGTLKGNVGGAGIKKGQLQVTIGKDFSAHGTFKGSREGSVFRIPLKDGSVSKKNNKLQLRGESNNNEARFDATVAKGTVGGTLKGKIHGKDFSTRVNLSE